MPEYSPVYNPANELTFTAGAPIVGGQLVGVTAANTVSPVGAGSAATVGVAAYDAAAGGQVTVFVKATVHETVTGAVVAAGQDLTTGAGGTVVPRGTGANRLGVALTSAGSGQLVRWLDIDTKGTPKATTANAGTPGTFTPGGSLTPANFADLAGVTANPATAWTTGQRVVLGDASLAYWTGTAWAVGTAP